MKRLRFFWNADVWNFSLLFSFLYIDGRNNIVSRMKKMCLRLINMKRIGVVGVSC